MRLRRLACAALLLAAARIAATPVAARIQGLDDETASALRTVLEEALRADYGRRIILADADAAATGGTVTIDVRASGGALTLRTTLSFPSGVPRSITSHAASPKLAVPVLAGDLLALVYGDRPSEALALDEASPVHVLTVTADAVTALTGKPADITDIAYGPEGLVLALPDGPLAVDTLFHVTPETARDLLLSRRSPMAVPVMRLQSPMTGLRIMLLADQATVLTNDPVTGDILTARPEGGPFAGLAAMPWGGYAVWTQRMEGPAAEVVVGRRRGDEITHTRFTVSPALVTAVAADYDGNVWMYDAVERRIRVFDSSGREIHAIKPQLDRSAFALPRQIAVYPDGSFLISGEGEIWKLDRSGMPLWRLRAMDPEAHQSLPRSFRFALHGAVGAFSMLDPETRRIHVFSERALAGDLTAGLACPAGERALTEEIARATVSYAERMAGALDVRAADTFYADAIERYRALRASDPTTIDYARALDSLTARRALLREALPGFLDAGVRIEVPVLHAALPAALAMRLAPVAGSEAPPMEGVTAEIASGRYVRPATITLGDLTAERETPVPLALEPDAGMVEEDRAISIGLRLSGTVARESVSSLQTIRTTLSSRLRFDADSASRAGYLAWLAAGPDACVSRLAASALAGSALAGTPSPLQTAGLIFGLLGDSFRIDAATPGQTQTPRQSASAMRGSPEDALVLAAALLRGTRRAFLTAANATYLLLDTGLPLPATGRVDSAIVALATFARSGTVLLPLKLPADRLGSTPLTLAARHALEELAAGHLAGAAIEWVGDAGIPTRGPYLPVYAVRRPYADARGMIDAEAARALGARLGAW